MQTLTGYISGPLNGLLPLIPVKRKLSHSEPRQKALSATASSFLEFSLKEVSHHTKLFQESWYNEKYILSKTTLARLYTTTEYL